MPELDPIKAKVVIEYDGSGASDAEKDLVRLAGLAGSFGELASGAGDGLAQLDEHAQSLASSVGDLVSPMEEGRRAIWQLVEGGAPGQQMLTGMADSADGAGESLVQLGERAQSLVSPMEAGRKAIWQMVEGGAPGQQMLIGMGEAAQTLQGQLPPVSDGFTRIGESLSQTVPMLPQFAEGLQVVDASAGSHGIGSFADNIAAFQDALVNPAPFEAIASHLIDTGQTWGEFTSSIGEQNANMLRSNQDFVSGLQDAATQTGSSINQVNDSLSATGTNFNEASGGAAEFTQQFTATGAAASDASKSIGGISSAFGDAAKSANEGINAFGGVGDKLYGPLDELASLKPVGMGEAFGGTMSAVMDGMGQLMMPLMAVQMIGMAVGAVGQGIYDMAGIAEGPAAHSLGTFTGSVDALGQTAQKSAEQFSESFGRAVMPTLDAMNYQMSQGGSSGDIGAWIGTNLTTLFNVARIGTGIDPIGAGEGIANQFASAFGMAEPFQGPGPASPQLVQAQQIQAQLAQSTAVMQAQANDPTYLAAQAYLGSQQHDAQVAQASYTMSHYSGTTGPLDPMNSIIQAELIQSGGGSYGGNAGMDAQYQQYAQQEGPQFASAQANAPNYLQSIGQDISQGNWGGAGNDFTQGTGLNLSRGLYGLFGLPAGPGVGDILGGVGDFFNKMFSGGPGTGGPSPFYDNSSPFSNGANNAPYEGCFTAGTRVRMADGSEKAIETLQVGECVLGSDGTKQVSTSIRALILPPPKRVYTLTFSDGNTLTLTDAHPISTSAGWKSIEPKSTAKENPTLEVSRLMWGDVIHTLDGTCQLASITPCKGKVQVYNIEVDNPHTFYANGVLVHNKLQSQVGQQAADQIGGIQLPHLDLSGMASTLGGDFSSIQLPHLDLSGMASGVGSAFSGISLPHLDLSGMASGIGSAFSGISLPHIDLSSISSSLSGAFSGISIPSIPNIGAQISSQLGSMFSGISLPSIPDIGAQISGALSGMFGGISIPSIPNLGGMISGAMSGMFGGISLPSIPDLGGMLSGAMSGMFGGISLPSIPDLGGMLTGAMSGMFGGISLPSIPFFASGVQGFAGGAAVVGEAGTEVAEYNGQYALFDQGAAFVNLPAGSSVYPIQDMASYNSPRMLAQGTGGGGFSPLSLGSGGGSMPQSINLSVHLDSQAILSAIGLPLSQNIRVQSGMRGY